MSVSETEKIDIIAQRDDGSAKLVITDHLPWDDPEHLFLLQEKINAYLAFIETGQIAEHTGPFTRVEIQVVMLHQPDAKAREFLMQVGEICGRAGYSFRFKVQDDA